MHRDGDDRRRDPRDRTRLATTTTFIFTRPTALFAEGDFSPPSPSAATHNRTDLVMAERDGHDTIVVGRRNLRDAGQRPLGPVAARASPAPPATSWWWREATPARRRQHGDRVRARVVRHGRAVPAMGRDRPGMRILTSPATTLSRPDLIATRAITVQALRRPRSGPGSPSSGRAGAASTLRRLENLVGCDIHSADRDRPRVAGHRVGDEVKLASRGGAGRDRARAGTIPGAARWGADGHRPAPYDFTWAFVLRDAPDGTTRLLVRDATPTPGRGPGSWSSPSRRSAS